MSTTKIEDMAFEIKLDTGPLRKFGETFSEAAAAFGASTAPIADLMTSISEAQARDITAEFDRQQKEADRKRRKKALGKPGVRWR